MSMHVLKIYTYGTSNGLFWVFFFLKLTCILFTSYPYLRLQNKISSYNHLHIICSHNFMILYKKTNSIHFRIMDWKTCNAMGFLFCHTIYNSGATFCDREGSGCCGPPVFNQDYSFSYLLPSALTLTHPCAAGFIASHSSLMCCPY